MIQGIISLPYRLQLNFSYAIAYIVRSCGFNVWFRFSVFTVSVTQWQGKPSQLCTYLMSPLVSCSGLVMEGYLFKRSSNAFRSWHR